MAPKFLNVLLLAIAPFLFSRCQHPTGHTEAVPGECVYENEYGEIRIRPENDSLVRAVFKNNAGNEFDTTLFIQRDFNLLPQTGTLPFLKLRMGGLYRTPDYVRVEEFSNLTFLAQFIRIENLYERPFYRTDSVITVRGNLIQGKGGATVDGIYLKNYADPQTGYVWVRGTVKKEKYPREFYSTADSPQGMFGDTAVVHYRLMMENYSLEKPKAERMAGYTLNVNGQAHFVWEFADSESYRLENHAPWTTAEEHQKITLEAILVQDERGSVLKDWQIVSIVK